MSKLFKYHAVSYLTGDLKTNREGSLTKHVGFAYAYAKKAKNRKINDEKGGNKQKKQES